MGGYLGSVTTCSNYNIVEYQGLIDKRKIKRYLGQLEKAKKPTKFSSLMGLDGEMYSLKIETNEGAEEYSWWCEGDDDYKELSISTRRELSVCC
ncbi:MAG: hypothetical protein OEX07_00370 [Gammaproteobacteria bacterium]|nr:hypothetical protein [Gammaproteobacteria bacterium]